LLNDAHGGYHTIDRGDLKKAGEILQEYREEQKEAAQEKSGNKNVTQSPNVNQNVTQILF